MLMSREGKGYTLPHYNCFAKDRSTTAISMRPQPSSSLKFGRVNEFSFHMMVRRVLCGCGSKPEASWELSMISTGTGYRSSVDRRIHTQPKLMRRSSLIPPQWHLQQGWTAVRKLFLATRSLEAIPHPISVAALMQCCTASRPPRSSPKTGNGRLQYMAVGTPSTILTTYSNLEN